MDTVTKAVHSITVLHVPAAARLAMVDPTAVEAHLVAEVLAAVEAHSAVVVPIVEVAHSAVEVPTAEAVHSAVALPVAVVVPLAEAIIVGAAKAEATAAEAVFSAEAVNTRTSAFIIRWTSRIGHLA